LHPTLQAALQLALQLPLQLPQPQAFAVLPSAAKSAPAPAIDRPIRFRNLLLLKPDR
jgi:hypothetical protein